MPENLHQNMNAIAHGADLSGLLTVEVDDGTGEVNFFYADGSPVVIRNSTRSVVDRVMESQHVDLVAQQERIEAFSYWARGTLQGFADVINCVNSDERRFLLEGLKDRLAHSIKQFEGWLFMFLTRENAYLDPKSEACATLLGMYGRVDGLRDQMNDRNSLVSTWRELSDLIFEASKCLIDCLTAGNNGRARHDLLIPILKAGSKVVDGESPVGTQSKIHETLSPSITSFDITIARVLTEIEYILDEAERARGENKNAHSGEEGGAEPANIVRISRRPHVGGDEHVPLAA